LCQWQAHHDPHRRLHPASMQSGRDECRLRQCSTSTPELTSQAKTLTFEDQDSRVRGG
jgi:hypothetical protein